MARELTDDDISSIIYFHEAKDDITRYCDWEEIKPLVEKRFPELIHAMKQVEIHNNILNRLVRSLEL